MEVAKDGPRIAGRRTRGRRRPPAGDAPRGGERRGHPRAGRHQPPRQVLVLRRGGPTLEADHFKLVGCADLLQPRRLNTVAF